MLATLALLLVMQAAHSLVPTRMFPNCLTNPLDLIPDPEDCHIFYQCDLNPQPMSCGDLMFNSLRQVCDWPSTVLQLRPECRQEEQFRFSGQVVPFRRTLRMLNFFGDGDRFSQKRLRAPQDVGLGRRKNFGNREYFGEESGNGVEEDVNYDYYEDDEFIENNERQQTEIVEDNTRTIDDKDVRNLNVDIQEIRRRQPQRVQNSFSNNQYSQQAISTPADTVRIQSKKMTISAEPQITRPNPSPYIKVQQDSPFVAPPQGPSFGYQHAYPGQAAPSPIPAPVAAPAPAFSPASLQVHYVPADNPTPISTTPDITPADTVRLGTKNIPQQQNNGQASLSTFNQPKLAPILVEETREYKPVWTVTRERPRQILHKYRNGKTQNRHQADCADKNCPKVRQRVLRKTKRKLIVGEKNQLKERRKLIQETESDQERLGNLHEEEESFDFNEKKAVTLKEAYDRAIRKVDQIGKNNHPAPGNMLREILNRDFGSQSNKDYGEYSNQNYVNSDDLRSRVLREELNSSVEE